MRSCISGLSRRDWLRSCGIAGVAGLGASLSGWLPALAEDILENGMKTPIQVRHDGKRHILVEGLHRLEAAKWLGETMIDAYLVQAKRH